MRKLNLTMIMLMNDSKMQYTIRNPDKMADVFVAA